MRWAASRANVALLGILAVALFLRLWNDSTHFSMFWFDEAEYAYRGRWILEHGGVYPLALFPDHPPLVPYVLAGAFWLFGPTPAVARATSILAGVATVLVVHATGTAWRDRRTGLVAAALVAVVPLATFVTREVVLEPVLVLLCSLSLLFVVRILRQGAKMRDLLLFGLCAGLAFLAKMSAAILVPVALVLAWRARLWRRPAAWAGAAVAALVPLPIYVGLFRAGAFAAHGSRITGATAVLSEHGSSLLFLALFANVLLVPAAWGAWRTWREQDAFGLSLLALLGGLLALVIALPLFAPHYVYPAVPALALLAALPLSRAPKALAATAGPLAAISLAGVIFLFSMTSLTHAQEAIMARVEPGDVILTSDPPVFRFATPEQAVLPPTVPSLETLPRWLVLSSSDAPKLASHPLFARYELVEHIAPLRFEESYDIFERRS